MIKCQPDKYDSLGSLPIDIKITNAMDQIQIQYRVSVANELESFWNTSMASLMNQLDKLYGTVNRVGSKIEQGTEPPTRFSQGRKQYI